MELLGLVLVLIGLGVVYLARQSEGLSGAFFFLLGVLLFLMGIYLLFFEKGEGVSRWLPFLGN
jgi:sulfite exporter TauE/SafE